MNAFERDENQPRDPALGVPRREIGEDGVRRVSSSSSGADLPPQSLEAEDPLRLGIPKRDRIVSSAVSDIPLSSDDRLFNGDDVADQETASNTREPTGGYS